MKNDLFWNQAESIKQKLCFICDQTIIFISFVHFNDLKTVRINFGKSDLGFFFRV